MAFYHRLEPFLAEKKMSQKDLADIAGVTPPSVFEWKNQGTMPRADTTIKIADYFNVSVKWLITGERDAELSQEERDLLDAFRLLDDRDQEDVLGIVQGKIERAKKGDILSRSENA
jgi:HTH-type transcriptional regulator, cell division transcriptional repressor